MAWKSREEKQPPPQYFADAVAYLHRAYPRAVLSRSRMEELKPFLIAEWRNGQTAHDAAKATCACDGLEIVPSPATGVLLPKRSVRPPQGAVRGSVYGLDELREPSHLAKLRVGVAMAQRKAEYEESKALQAEAKLKVTRSDGARTRLYAQFDRALDASRAHRKEEERLRKDLQTALALAGWTQADEGVALASASTTSPPARPQKAARRMVSPANPRNPSTPAKKKCTACTEAPAPASSLPLEAEVGALSDEAAEQLANQFAAASARDRRQE